MCFFIINTNSGIDSTRNFYRILFALRECYDVVYIKGPASPKTKNSVV